ncbi:MAG TPA: hypothetical protein VJP79_12660, partial [Nitrososphaera sp.]|nr:hypothetical protein [Nitrososphaera sp.]
MTVAQEATRRGSKRQGQKGKLDANNNDNDNDNNQVDSGATEIVENIEETSKLAKIALIVEIMEESRKGKDWLIDQIKQKRQKIAITPAMNTVGILKMCSLDVVSNLLISLQSKERYDIDVIIPPVTREYHWFFTDIVAASDPTKTTMDQARKII